MQICWDFYHRVRLVHLRLILAGPGAAVSSHKQLAAAQLPALLQVGPSKVLKFEFKYWANERSSKQS